ncbi:MAG: hypothetical protein AABX75_02205 [Nanoarchaeota archaeon]
MGKPISEETRQKIIEAHGLKLSACRAAEHANVSEPTILKYWGVAGLSAHFERPSMPPISEETQQRIIETHKLGLSATEAAKRTGVATSSVLRYWKDAGLNPHFRRGKLPISEETRQKIIEAYRPELSASKIAKRVGANHGTILKYWKAAGLTPCRNRYGPISEEKQNLIYTAWELKIGARKTAEYLKVNINTVYEYWRRLGLALPPRVYTGRPGGPGRFINASLTNLLDDVFDTVKNPGEQLELEQIVQRLKKRLGTERINVKDLQEKIDKLVGWGYYAVAQDGGKTYYKAGMPAAMDGNFKAAVAR